MCKYVGYTERQGGQKEVKEIYEQESCICVVN